MKQHWESNPGRWIAILRSCVLVACVPIRVLSATTTTKEDQSETSLLMYAEPSRGFGLEHFSGLIVPRDDQSPKC